MKKVIATLMLLALLLVGLTAAQAQGNPNIIYYVAADSDGVQQVYQHLLDGTSEPRQITDAANDVITFGAAHDSLSIAYISAGELWLQPLHTEAEMLTTVSAERFFGSAIVYSPDNQYIAYADNGVWLFDLGTRETRQILENVEVKADGSNMGEMRLYEPEMFVLNDAGQAVYLTLSVGVWEWTTAGVYNLETGELQLLEGQVHTDVLPLPDGRALLYGNGGVAGEFALHMADSLENINDYTQVVNFADLTDMTLYAQQALEIEPGLVRIVGETIGEIPHEPYAFTFDFNAETGDALDVTFIKLPVSDNTVKGDLSPDGTLLPVYSGTLWTDAGSIYGSMTLMDVITGEATDVQFPETVGVVRWQE